MNAVAKFSKVSFEQFKRDYNNIFGNTDDDIIKTIYDGIKLPKRATIHSAGYDFYSPIEVNIKTGEHILIPTGIRCEIDPDWLLSCYPRSGLGFKYGMKLDNSVGIIDSDYYNSDNEGHIMAKFSTDAGMILNVGDRFMQGVFTMYGITKNDDTAGVRNGGFGSSGK